MKKLVLTIIGTLLCINTVMANQTRQSFNAPFVKGEVLVKLNSNMKISKDLASLGLSIKKHLSLLAGEYVIIKIENSNTVMQTIRILSRDPSIDYAEPNYLYKIIKRAPKLKDLLVGTNDPKFGKLWGLFNTGSNEPRTRRGNSSPSGVAGADINAINAWKITTGSKAIKIAVIDTGVDYNHPDLKNNIWTNDAEANGQIGVDDDGNGYVDDIHGYDFANKDGDPMDGNGHGTHCSGTIAAEHGNGIGVAGVMADAEIIGVKFLTDKGSGSTDVAIQSIDYATKMGVDIMSNSWGGGGFSQALMDSIVRANQAGIVFTAAAGNSSSNNDSTPHYPSNYDVENIISVAAHNYNDELASFSCYGQSTVHVVAPGRNILSTTPNNQYGIYSGTSMATPHVTGVIGLYLAHNGVTNPKVLRDNLMATSVYGPAYARKTISGGRVDAYNFISGIITERPELPKPGDWISKDVGLFESGHPYKEETNISKKYTIPGAKFVRAVIKRHDIEKNYDFLLIKDGKGNEIQRIDGQGRKIKTEYVEGNSIIIEFHSDSSVNRWGFIIDQVEIINK